MRSLLLIIFAWISVAVQADKCNTDLHPVYGVKGTCIERTECMQQGGFYEDNWCMSEKPSIKCCFLKHQSNKPDSGLSFVHYR
jgi:hypothetical protein